LECFKPNLMPFVQPCDVGIICCFKAIYHCKLSIHAIDLDEVGELEIYTINLLEAMLMAKSAWNAVLLETIKHFWDHTNPAVNSTTNSSASPSSLHLPHADPIGWQIVHEFATTEMNLPNAEACLAAHLGHHYVNTDWQPALRAVMDAEGDVAIAMKAVEPLLSNANKMLMTPVSALHECNHIFGKLLTLEEILDPAEEQETGDSGKFDQTDKAIVASV
ncbi:hypothetical protein BS17DRAFT_719628, partial [Gyrodon lividus]